MSDDLRRLCIDGTCKNIPNKSEIIDMIYPVGSLYMNANSVNPGTIFSGTSWEKVEDRFLLASGSQFPTLKATGGSRDAVVVSHTHVQDPHTHTQNPHNHTQNSHNHTQDSHNHTQDQHAHEPADVSKFICSDQDIRKTGNKLGFPATSASGVYYVVSDNNAGIGEWDYTANTTATNQATTATNQEATATNQEATATNQNATATNQSTGVDGKDKNLPPYIVVNVWIRTA